MPRVCQVCQLSSDLQRTVADQYRREVPLRTIADELRAAGHPVHRDTIWRHCRNHLVSDTEYGPSGPSNPAALTVATVVGGVLSGWPRLLGECEASLRAEGLHAAADVVIADVPETMRAAIAVAVGTPASRDPPGPGASRGR